MENVEIARMLEEYADLLDIHEANPFRVRSYHKAARPQRCARTPGACPRRTARHR